VRRRPEWRRGQVARRTVFNQAGHTAGDGPFDLADATELGARARAIRQCPQIEIASRHAQPFAGARRRLPDFRDHATRVGYEIGGVVCARARTEMVRVRARRQRQQLNRRASGERGRQLEILQRQDFEPVVKAAIGAGAEVGRIADMLRRSRIDVAIVGDADEVRNGPRLAACRRIERVSDCGSAED
jgi:hypothetical protein